MRLQPLVMTFIGIALVGGSIFAAQNALTKDGASAQASTIQPERQATVLLLTAAVDIPYGTDITRDKLSAQSWPADAAPKDAFDSASVLLGPEGTAPRRALRSIRAGGLIARTEVSNFGENVTISSTLSDNARAMAITVSAATAVGGFVAPGDRVDIVLTQGRGETLRTGTILQNIRVLGIDEDPEKKVRSVNEERTITVEVTPMQSQTLALSQQAGVLTLSLRRGDGTGTSEALNEITMDDIWKRATPAAPVAEVAAAPVAAPVTRTVKVRRGTEEQDVAVE